MSHSKVGSIYQEQGRLDAALYAYQAGKRIMEGLAALDPANIDWLRDLSVSHNRIGRIYQLQRKLAKAIAEYEADLKIAERLALHDPTNSLWREDLLISRIVVEKLRNPSKPK